MPSMFPKEEGEAGRPGAVRRVTERRRTLLIICATAIAARLFVGPHVADDAYITFRYGENVAAGAGLVYNVGERVQGTTAPLFALVLAVASALGLNLSWTSFTINAAADLVTIAGGATLLVRAGWPLAAMLYGVALAFWPSFITYSVSGLETSTYVALSTTAWLLADAGRGGDTGIAVGLATLCRPDGALIAPPLVAYLCWRHGFRPARNAAIAGAVTLLPWAVFAVTYYHALIPASVAAKAHTRLTRRPLPAVIASVRPCWIVSYESHLDPALSSAPFFTRDYGVILRRRVGPERELLVFRRH